MATTAQSTSLDRPVIVVPALIGTRLRGGARDGDLGVIVKTVICIAVAGKVTAMLAQRPNALLRLRSVNALEAMRFLPHAEERGQSAELGKTAGRK
jgi:hypothetical protein